MRCLLLSIGCFLTPTQLLLERSLRSHIRGRSSVRYPTVNRCAVGTERHRVCCPSRREATKGVIMNSNQQRPDQQNQGGGQQGGHSGQQGGSGQPKPGQQPGQGGEQPGQQGGQQKPGQGGQQGQR